MANKPVHRYSFRHLKERFLGSSFLQATSGSFLLKIAATLLGLVTSIVLARILEPDGYGLYSYTLAWVNFLFVPAMLGFDRLIIREVSISLRQNKWEHLKGLLKWTNIISFVLSIILITVVFVLVSFTDIIPQQDKAYALLVALPLLPVLTLTTLRQSAMQGLHRVVRGQLPESLFRPLFLLGIISFVYFIDRDGFNTTTAITSNVIAAALAFFIGARLLIKVIPGEVRSAPTCGFQREWLHSALPLMMVGVMQTINAQISILALGYFHENAEVGLFAIARQISSIGTFFIMSFNSVLAPRFAHLYSSGNMAELQRLVAKSSLALAILAAPVALTFIVFGKPLLAMFGPDYVSAYWSLMILSVGVFFNSAVGSIGLLLTMTKHEKVAVKGLVISLVINLMLSFLLIPTYGAEGAALATALYLLIWNVIFCVFVYREVKIIPSFLSYFINKNKVI